jgi:GPH family glycoside/pentoside/hexuronide:cation symporter
MKLRPKWGMRKIILRFGIIKDGLTLGLFFLIINIDLPILIVLTLAVRTFFNGYNIFKSPILYLSIDEDELKTGSRREGMFMGINALFHKPALSLGPIVATFVLGLFGYIQGGGVGDQPPSAFLGIKILMFLIPVIVSLIGLVFLYFYPIHGDNLDEMRKQLSILHAEKRERLE